MPTDDRTLLRKTHAGHEHSARELWHRHAGWMLAFARSVLGGRSVVSADDVVQSVFCRLLALDRSTIRDVREVRPWLARLVRHEALNQIRTARRTATREAAARPTRAADEPGAPTLELVAAMAELPRRLREVAHLRHVVGLTTDQTALALGVPRGTVAGRCAAAMRTLRSLLGSPSPDATNTTPTGTTPVGDPCHALTD
jgi:RNA polymerase sigma factor (sigma-70 family)